MTCKNNNYPPIYASGHYYSKKEFTFPINAVNQTVNNTTVLKNNSGITLIYFRSGEGSIIINSKPYEIKRGMLICLGSYHYFQIKPSNVSIELMQCRLSYDTFLYMAANPYYDFSEITLNPKPLTALLEGEMLERAENIIEELVDTSSKSRKKENCSKYKDLSQSGNISDRFLHKSGNTEFFLCMRLIGILQKTYQVDFWK
ncbi:hypothetical protein [Proteocatella sphenisci]|uniref:hypothetical protein n=1 Tax=Proteocatella sphenisci TaxID=181070 RepID=UPI00048F24B2|nr:hypothetical protein [Proteocatella sphenisci]